MPIQLARNQYNGINAHLHSYWQAEGGWDGFHTNHLADLTRALRAHLLPKGYTAEIEQSLQIRRFGEPVGKPESDVTIYDIDPSSRGGAFIPVPNDTHTLTMPIPQALNLADGEIAQYRAIAVYTVEAPSPERVPITWVELLSPSNKPGGQDAAYYYDKRLKLLHSGIVFIEMDYLHESPPTFERIGNYSAINVRENGDGHPYRIIALDPRPSFEEGTFFARQFDVDEAISTMTIPLAGDDSLDFDFNAPYQKTYEEMLYGLQLVDYEVFPHRFTRYSQADQARIQSVMARASMSR